MGPRELPQLVFVIDYVQSDNGSPTGQVKRVRYSGGQILSEEEIELPIDELILTGRPRT
jgi:hypothetical protein